MDQQERSCSTMEGVPMNEDLSQADLEIQAAVFRRLIAHLQERTDVQNIDLMNLAGFCRNCLSKWHVAESEARGLAETYDEARERVYGMPYATWKAAHQKEASPEQLEKFQRGDNR